MLFDLPIMLRSSGNFRFKSLDFHTVFLQLKMYLCTLLKTESNESRNCRITECWKINFI